MDILLALFVEPIQLTGWWRLVMMLPLCLGIAVVYKALKLDDLRSLPIGSLALWATLVVGMMAVGVVLMVGYELLR
ncbi:MAG TPA: hypothetical protein VMZ31_12235 [Phycisphaerae bacterium]|nr:hypothetical protein [Phycisphaerae bacterium]